MAAAKPKNEPSDGPASSIRSRLEAIEDGARTVICIPVWGWTGHGKTCALLTATQHAQVEKHGLTYAIVKDTRGLEQLEATEAKYKGLGLANAARVTREKVRELYELFFSECQWPHGTETPTAYLFEVRSAQGTAGYVVFPDIRGGSYQELDATALTAIDGAHGCILVLDAKKYAEVSPSATEYRDDVLRLMQSCNERSIPLLLIIAKSDTLLGSNSGPLDETRKRLSQLTNGFKTPPTIVAASALNEDKPVDTKAPLPAGDRHVDTLVTAWVSMTLAALSRSREELLAVRPPTNLQAPAMPQAIAGKKRRELRRIRELSDGPGRLVYIDGQAPNLAFLFLDSATSKLHEATVDLRADAYKFGMTVEISDWKEEAAAAPLCAVVRSGTVFLGARYETDAIWIGARGQDLQRTPFPSPMISWCPVAGERLVGIDSQGKLHSLRLVDSKWHTHDYIESFATPSAITTVGVLQDGRHVLCLTGAASQGVVLDASGNYAERLDLDVKLTYNKLGARVNELGFSAAVTQPNALHVALQGAMVSAGTIADSSEIAIARTAPVVAWTSPEKGLIGGILHDKQFAVTGADLAPEVVGELSGICWSSDGSILGSSYKDGRWAWYRALGF
jgi:hypothetical protein